MFSKFNLGTYLSTVLSSKTRALLCYLQKGPFTFLLQSITDHPFCPLGQTVTRISFSIFVKSPPFRKHFLVSSRKCDI